METPSAGNDYAPFANSESVRCSTASTICCAVPIVPPGARPLERLKRFPPHAMNVLMMGGATALDLHVIRGDVSMASEGAWAWWIPPAISNGSKARHLYVRPPRAMLAVIADNMALPIRRHMLRSSLLKGK